MRASEKITAMLGRTEPIRILIIGLGSVGNYLLNYLSTYRATPIQITVAGRNREKLEKDCNIARIGALIRESYCNPISIEAGCNLEEVEGIARCIARVQPDILVNSSRAYPHLKYGSLSWPKLRAYGIWSPLAVKYMRNIMLGAEKAGSQALVINTSYSDAVIPWLRSAGIPYPEFGSGNLNHLVPRITSAAAELTGEGMAWEYDVTLATAHFHDVVISKEGQTEGVDPLLDIRRHGEKMELDPQKLYRLCKIPMPTDAQRNIMNASSNYQIIHSVLEVLHNGGKCKFHSPGALGEMGGYPVYVRQEGNQVTAEIDDSRFSLESMRQVNRRSLAMDGVEDIQDGCLIYTDELLQKTEQAFGVRLPKTVSYDEIDWMAGRLIQEILQPNR